VFLVLLLWENGRYFLTFFNRVGLLLGLGLLLQLRELKTHIEAPSIGDRASNREKTVLRTSSGWGNRRYILHYSCNSSESQFFSSGR
jgi:hypothetical protein